MVIVVSSLVFVGCGNSISDDLDNSELAEFSNQQQFEFTRFMDSLDSLNHEFVSSDLCETRAWGRDLTQSVADAVGGALGQKFGSSIGAAAGSAGGPAGAVVGYLVGRKYGGAVGTVAASTIAGAVYDWVTTKSDLPYIAQYKHYTQSINDEASIGEVHNVILSQIQSNGKAYVSLDGAVKIDEIYADVVSIVNKMGIEDYLCEIEEYKAYMKDFFKEIVDISLQDKHRITGDVSYKSQVTDFLCENKGFSEIEAQNIMSIISSTQISAYLRESQAIEYEKEFVRLVDNSRLSDQNKRMMIVTGSISIMSTNYWYADK